MKKNEIFIDPVCDMEIKKPIEKELQQLSTKHNNKAYYFCSPFCTAVFKQNPERYVQRDNGNSSNNKKEG